MTDQEVTAVVTKFSGQYSTLPKAMKYAIYCLVQQAFYGDSASIDALKVALDKCTIEQRTTLYNGIIQVFNAEHTEGLT